ncbi:hypothetical protein [Xanthomonas campestris]|uniref:hypothetical protein n=1 Tax=Xanthomonas campestris TaxID=339 RepID=UPI000E1E4E22|nr:hypothetical protein [Xanthomonas campestris]
MADRRFLIAVFLFGLSGCYYDDPYQKVDQESAAPVVKLERAFLFTELDSSGMPGAPSNVFGEAQSVYACAILSGQEGAEVQFVVLPSEGSSDEIASFRLKATRADQVVVQDVALAERPLEPGTYYVSVKVNGIPSWGLPFTVASASAGSAK